MPGSKRWVLIDGHSLAYRAFYALPRDLATSSGQLTNAVYGFTSMLIKVMEELKPQALIVAFDKGRAEFRTEMFAEYKAHRKPMPDELREQMDLIHGVLDVLNIPLLEEEGYEADDVLATLTGALPADSEVFIVTADRDALQLVDEHVRVVANRKGITDIVIYDPQGVKEKYGVEPGQIVDYLALKGDASDNIPGVPGIGEKTAAALISEYGSLDEVYEHLEEVKGAKAKKALEENRESAYMSRELASMRHDVPLGDGDASRWEMRPWEEEDVRRVFDSLEFRKLYDRLTGLKTQLFPDMQGVEVHASADEPMERTEVDSEDELARLLRSCRDAGELSLYGRIEGEGYTRGRMSAVSVASGGKVYRFMLDERNERGFFRDFLSGITSLEGLRLNCYRGKDIMVQCASLYSTYPRFDFDVELASYLVNPSGTKHDLESTARRYLDLSLAAGPPGQLDLLQEEEAKADQDMRCAMAVEKMVGPLEADMNLRDLRSLYEGVEMPLQEVLAEMEIRGIRLDTGVLEAMQVDWRESW